MYDDMITLIKQGKTANRIGDMAGTDTERDVFAEVKSVGSKRKLEALAVGLRLEWKFILSDYYEYDGEERVRYEGTEYEVTDTFRADDDSLEITVRRC